MNEFEWRRQLRELRQPQSPQHDLWARIDAALDATALNATESTPARRTMAPARRLPWLLMAASVAAVVILAGGLVWRLHQATMISPTAIAVASWKPADPRLAGAAVELGAAQIELKQAMQQAPDSAALQRLLNLTEQQQSRLRQFEHQAG
jgi:anti-sigma-K factor RskA